VSHSPLLRPNPGHSRAKVYQCNSVHLLRFEPTPTDVFGRQLAFNVLPEHLFPSGEEAAGAESRVHYPGVEAFFTVVK